jgi:hypothetical protein
VKSCLEPTCMGKSMFTLNLVPFAKGNHVSKGI